MFSCLHIHIRFLYWYFFITLSPDHHACITVIPLTEHKSKHWNVVVLHVLFLFGCYANTSSSLCPLTSPLKEKANSCFAHKVTGRSKSINACQLCPNITSNLAKWAHTISCQQKYCRSLKGNHEFFHYQSILFV